MPRPHRVQLRDVIYWVALEGPYNEPIFRDGADYQKYLELLAAHKKEFGFKLFSYALFSDHIYLLIEATETFPISRIMQQITPQYTKYFNARYERKGPLFQKRFHSIIVEKEPHLLELTRYAHLIPVQKKLSADASSYSYTSYRSYVAPEVAEAVLPTTEEVNEVLAGLGSLSYQAYMQNTTAAELKMLEKKLSRGAILGSEAFEHEVRERMKEDSHKEEPHKEAEAKEPAEAAAVGNSPAYFSKSLLALSSVLTLAISVSAFSVYLNYATSKVGAGFKPTPALVSTIPAAPDLNGTVWEIEMVAVTPEGKEQLIKDKIKFQEKTFESYYFSNRGFNRSNYTVTVNQNGIITWETIQRNEKGEIVSWRGDWQGNKMDGVLSYRDPEHRPQDFSFISQGAAR